MRDYQSALAETSSLRDQAGAATLFRSQGADGVKNLESLFAAMMRIDAARKDLSQFEIDIVGLGAMAISSTLDEAGIDPLSSGYAKMTEWILSNAQSPNTEVSAYCLYSLGQFNNHSYVGVSVLKAVAQSERRADENERITLRGIAFRMLARLAPDLAAPYINSDACQEFLAAIEQWSSESPASKDMLEKEVSWIRAKHATNQ
jgi:hypothetical protein